MAAIRARPGVGVVPRRLRAPRSAAGPTSAEPTGGTEEAPAPDPVGQSLRVIGEVLAPTTVLAVALLLYGRSYSVGFYRYFRVNLTTLSFTDTEYRIRASDIPVVPITVTGLVVLAGVLAHRGVVDRMPAAARGRILRIAVPLVGVLSAGFLGIAFTAVVWPYALPVTAPEAGGLSLAAGVLLLVYAVHLSLLSWAAGAPAQRLGRAGIGVAEWGLTFVLVAAGLLWGVGNYAFDTGRERAAATAASLPVTPDAVLYSERSLTFAVDGVTEVRCQDPEAAYRFRYDGLKLLVQAGDRYLLLPATWTPERGTAVLIPRTDDIRLEFAPPDVQRPSTC
jgi:hypothetical protein